MTIHSSAHFTHCAGKIWAAEISQLPRPVMRQVYPDACDLGLDIRSERTGKVETFRIKDEIRNTEGETEVWVLEPLRLSLRALGVEIHIIND